MIIEYFISYIILYFSLIIRIKVMIYYGMIDDSGRIDKSIY